MKLLPIFTVSLILSSQAIKAQTALDFDPASGLQQVFIPTITCPTEFTFEAWIYYRGQVDEFPTILEFEDDAPFFGLENDQLTLFDIIYSPDTIPTNQWLHVATTFSTLNSEAKLYINGVLIATELAVTLDISGIGAGIGFNDNIDHVFNGSIDDVRIWNVVRSEAEILANLNVCLTGSESGLYAYYNFNEGSGTAANDLTSNNFNGTLLNMDANTDWVPYTFCSGASLEDPVANSKITLFPNPSTSFLEVTGLTATENYVIYSALGMKMNAGIISNNEKLSTQDLDDGLYFLLIENGLTMKFIKE